MKQKKIYTAPEMKEVRFEHRQSVLQETSGDYYDEMGFAPRQQDPMA